MDFKSNVRVSKTVCADHTTGSYFAKYLTRKSAAAEIARIGGYYAV